MRASTQVLSPLLTGVEERYGDLQIHYLHIMASSFLHRDHH
jgi:hypothetical protein